MAILTPNWSPTIQYGCPYRVDWAHPITNKLSRVDVYNGVTYANALYSNRGQYGLTGFTNLNTKFSLGPRGVGLSRAAAGDSDWEWLASAANAPLLPNSGGSAFAYFTCGPLPTPGIQNYVVFDISDSSGASGFILYYIRQTAAQWSVGPYNQQAVYNADYPAGQTLTAGVTWGTFGVFFWLNGINVAQNTMFSAGAPDTTNAQYTVGGLWRGNAPFANWSMLDNTIARIYWILFWNRVLSDSEIAYLNANPMCFLIPAEYEMPALFLPAAPPSILYGHNIGANFTRKVTTIGY